MLLEDEKHDPTSSPAGSEKSPVSKGTEPDAVVVVSTLFHPCYAHGLTQGPSRTGTVPTTQSIRETGPTDGNG